jgi:putative flippase GtrA
MHRELLRFLLVGGICTALQYLVLVIGVEFARVDAVFASASGFLLSAVVNYLLNRRFTWASQAPHRVAARRFATVLVIGLVLNVLGMRLLHGYLHWHYVFAQVLTTVVTLLWNFTGHRRWTFATAATTNPPAAK